MQDQPQRNKRPDLRRDCDGRLARQNVTCAAETNDLIYEGIATSCIRHYPGFCGWETNDLIYEGIATTGLALSMIVGSLAKQTT